MNEKIKPLFTEEDLAINEEFYDWASRTFQSVEGRLGVNIKVHGNDDDLLNRGQIFLFNHFARFETIIPPYIIHRETGTYSRSVAHHGLFGAGGRFSRLMRDVGCVPNNQPGLLPFLAAEILRGRKVIIFPEGGMVKDRRVIDELGRFSIFSPSANAFRKHHRGAAVLAQTLEVFKRRIRDLFEEGDHARIDRWQKALGLPSPDALLEQANKPTLIVPGNITFYPVRVDDSILSRGAELFNRNLPRKVLEELSVEGNLLLRDTDMDIRFSEPMVPNIRWHWWEKILLKRYFLSIDSLNELFGLRDNAERWSERLLAESIGRDADRLRDLYMERIYSGITVNLAHLASVLLLALAQQKRYEITAHAFHNMLYSALKALQNAQGVHLHRSLTWPDRYIDLPQDVCPDLDRFIDSCTRVSLVEKVPGGYRLSEKIAEKYDYDEVRLQNPIQVNANEVGPIKPVKEAIEKALKGYDTMTAKELATHQFDDELRLYAWNRANYTKPRYQELNTKETASASGQPFLMLPKEEPKAAVLLVHGFMASPAEMHGFGESLTKQGYAVLGVRLAGHGTSPWELHHRYWEDWYQSVARGFRTLSAYARDVHVVGFSAGGTLSLLLAADNPPGLRSITTVCAPLSVQDRNIAFVPIIHGINRIARWVSDTEGVMPFRENTSENPDVNYRSMPLHALNELRGLMRAARRRLADVDVPVCIIQANEDPVVQPESAKRIFDGIGSDHKELHWVESALHGIIFRNVGKTREHILNFIEQPQKATAKAVPAKGKKSKKEDTEKTPKEESTEVAS